MKDKKIEKAVNKDMSLLEAYSKNDKKKIKEIEKLPEEGEIIMLM